MTTPTTTTAVATTDPLAAQRAKNIAEIKQRNAHAAAIRGTQWGREATPDVVRAVAHYCTINGLDPARHVEVLGARIYLTGELYEERGASLVLSGAVVVSPPEFVHFDKRLADLAKSEDADLAQWAKAEHIRRTKARIEYGIPDDATGACVIRAKVGQTELVGFNWCGGASKVKRKKDGSTYRSDPVGDAEPTKTAQSRAKRRMWRQIVVALPEYGASMGALEVSAKIVSGEIEDALDASVTTTAHPAALPAGAGEYTVVEPAPEVAASLEPIDEADRIEQLRLDAELAREEGQG